jgi:serine/threonine-protein phosphatase 2A regulatory subunit A
MFIKLETLCSIQRLAAGEWFTARVSACGFFHIAYPSAPEPLKGELRTIYGQLCQDDMPMVRRAAASNLGKFAATIEQSHLKTKIMSIFDDLTHDGTSCRHFYRYYFCICLHVCFSILNYLH